jgi:hypothetical protein
MSLADRLEKEREMTDSTVHIELPPLNIREMDITVVGERGPRWCAKSWRTRSRKLLGQLVQFRGSLLAQPQQVKVHARRHVVGAINPAPHGPIGHLQITGDFGLPARPIQSLAAALEQAAAHF